MHKKSGFSLVELSIVMVVIGLLVGGTLAGQSLIRSARLKTLVSEVNKYKASLNQFKISYSGLPGDIKNASSYFTGATNGDADDTIDAETSNEPFAAMSQLAAAGFIEGTFTGSWGTGFTAQSTASSGNTPTSSSGVEGALIYIKCCSGTDYARTISFNNHVSVFAINTNTAYRSGVLTPIEAMDIDKKTDDGIPDFGLVGASGSYNGTNYVATGCYSGTGKTSTYDSAVAANKDKTYCQMQFAYDWD